MRRPIDLHVHGPPKSDPHCCAVWCRRSLIMHGVFSPSDLFGPKPSPTATVLDPDGNNIEAVCREFGG
jgi:hypothetical protein